MQGFPARIPLVNGFTPGYLKAIPIAVVFCWFRAGFTPLFFIFSVTFPCLCYQLWYYKGVRSCFVITFNFSLGFVMSASFSALSASARSAGARLGRLSVTARSARVTFVFSSPAVASVFAGSVSGPCSWASLVAGVACRGCVVVVRLWSAPCVHRPPFSVPGSVPGVPAV